jgi:glycine/sarcosine N-methyltransferase
MYHHLSKYYNQLFPINENLYSQMERYMQKGKKAIDLGCGTGRLTKIIFDHQMDVTGIDLDSEMIRYAATSYPEIKFFEQNMVDALEDHYHLITCFGNTMPHLSPENLKIFLDKAKAKLDLQGYLIIEMLNYDKIMKEKPSHLKPIRVNDIHFTRLYEYVDDSIIFTTVLEFDQQKLIGSTKLYPYKLEQIEQMIRTSNLNCNIYADLEQTEFKDSDYRFYIVITQP